VGLKHPLSSVKYLPDDNAVLLVEINPAVLGGLITTMGPALPFACYPVSGNLRR
jgi:hypothetical protein